MNKEERIVKEIDNYLSNLSETERKKFFKKMGFITDEKNTASISREEQNKLSKSKLKGNNPRKSRTKRAIYELPSYPYAAKCNKNESIKVAIVKVEDACAKGTMQKNFVASKKNLRPQKKKS